MSTNSPDFAYNRYTTALKTSLFFLIHAGCLLAFYTGWSWSAVTVCFALYFIRMFGITGAYHRYFSHRTYKTSRWFQFCLGFLGATSVQKGPLWWAAHHRHHHKYSDTEQDIHSAFLKGLWWSHVGWILSPDYLETKYENVKDFMGFPEIKWLEKNHAIPGIVLIVLVLILGWGLQRLGFHTNPFQMFIWGFCISTTLLYHGTFCINSLAHMVGNRRFETDDHSKNSFILSIITLGEGWHNNHHRYPGSEAQGMYWWEMDITHYILKAMSWVGLVWDIRTHPDRLYDEAEGRK